jgi:hypothetical protein
MIKFPEQEKEWNKQRGETLEDDLDILLSDLCVIWGFVGGLTGWELAHDGGTITADSFAQALLAAQEMTAHEAASWLPKIKAVFTERYGTAVSKVTFDRR